MSEEKESPVAYEALSFDGASEVRCHPSRTRVGTTRVLVLAYEGTYRNGSAGTPDAHRMVADAKRALVLWNVDALVFDLRALDYRWGDNVLALFEVEEDAAYSPLPRVIVVSERSHAGIESLFGGRGTLYGDLGVAVREVARLAVEQSALEEANEDTLKMYILVRDDVPLGFAITAAAHASLAAYDRFQSTWEMRAWMCGVFRKVVCRVTAEEFERAKAVPDHVVLTESAWKNDVGNEGPRGGQAARETAIAFKPRVEWPKSFRHFSLYT